MKINEKHSALLPELRRRRVITELVDGAYVYKTKFKAVRIFLSKERSYSVLYLMIQRFDAF